MQEGEIEASSSWCHRVIDTYGMEWGVASWRCGGGSAIIVASGYRVEALENPQKFELGGSQSLVV